MHVTNAYAILFLASAKTGDNKIFTASVEFCMSLQLKFESVRYLTLLICYYLVNI